MPSETVEEIPRLVKDSKHRQYVSGEKLGKGGFATCFAARQISRRDPVEASECALKVVQAVGMPNHLAKRFRIELEIHSKLRHSNIVEFYRAFTYQDLTYVALEICHNGSLADMVKRRKYLTMGEIRRFLIQLCGAVKYLHRRDVVHRDIKAGNIFLDSAMNVKLGDFGLAAVVEGASANSSTFRRTTFCGTPNYLAPEVLNREGGHGVSVDIWAIGILAYYLAVGRAPFHSKSREEIYDRLRTGTYSWPELAPDQNEIPEDLRSLVGTLLVEESQRPTPNHIVRHAFFSNGFIPEKLDPLCRSRRPRWARGGTSGTLPVADGKVYERLCRESCVGISPVPRGRNGQMLPPPPPREKSVILALEQEYSGGVLLEIPLKEGVVYTGQAFAETLPKVVLENIGEGEEQQMPQVAQEPKDKLQVFPNEIESIPDTRRQRPARKAVVKMPPVILEDIREAEELVPAQLPQTKLVRDAAKKIFEQSMARVLKETSGNDGAGAGSMRAPSKRPRRAGVNYE